MNFNHYITLDDHIRIRDGWYDGAVLLRRDSDYHVQLFAGDNCFHPLHTADSIPLYRWDGSCVLTCSAEEIAAGCYAYSVEAAA